MTVVAGGTGTTLLVGSLASLADLATWIGRDIETDEEGRASMLLAAASQLLRGSVRQDFTRVEDDTVTLRPDAGQVVLPQRPADAPTLVAYAGFLVGGYRLTGTVFGFGWDGIDTVHGVGRWPVTVTYSHGFAVIPTDVVAAVCTAVGRALGDPAAGAVTAGVTEESIDDYRYKLATPAGTVGFLADEVFVLRRAYGRTAGTIVMRP